ncbi:MAG TPA: hypothetical protein DIT18_01330 [Pseudomonas sp.]|nr:hypothetical protein [Pseudomonas sp.]
MSKPTIQQLLDWFYAADRSFGWEFIVAYDRRTINAVLLHQYIQHFDDSRRLPPYSASIPSPLSTEHLSRMELRSPQMSFEHSSLDGGEAHMSMDFMGGMLISEEHPSGENAPSYISKIREIVPVAAPRLSFTVPLTKLTGGGGDARSIILDLSAGDDYKVNFALDSLTQEEIGRRFRLFLADLSADYKRFTLGRVSEDLGVPRKILMRVMPAPGAGKEGSATHGDGALLLFSRFILPHDGTIPGPSSDFPYPIAADVENNPYTITVLMFPPSPSALAARQGLETSQFPIILEDFFLGEHLCNYGWAFALSVEHVQMGYYGDMALRDTAFQIDPVQPLVVAGSTQQFSVKPAATSLKWSVRATEEGDSAIGTISASGLYTAPSSVVYASKAVVVSVEGVIGGSKYSASALVSILRESVAVSPIFAVCGHGKSLELSAETPPGSPLPGWTLRSPGQGGKLSTGSGRTCVYTAKTASFGTPPYMDLVDVRNPRTSEVKAIQVLVLTDTAQVPLFLGEDSRPESNAVQLRVVYDGVEMDLGDLAEEYTVVQHGYSGGKIDARGVYSAPADAKGVAILLLTIPDPFASMRGILALPLPLWAHADALGRSNASLRLHAGSGPTLK